MTESYVLAAKTPGAQFTTMRLRRRDLRATDILIDIAFAGICHSDLHHVASDWGHSHFPMVPGHEIVGVVTAVGEAVQKFRVGDRAGIGCLVGSCGHCEPCVAGLEQYCPDDVLTYNGIDSSGEVTYGGYSDTIVVDEAFAVRIPASMPLAATAPLLCAGITLYSPLHHWGAGPGKRVGIVGFGGLGHVGVQISRALGAHTTVLNLSDAPESDARRLGADDYRLASDPATFTDLAGTFDLLVSTVPASLDLDAHLRMLKLDGTLVNLGVPPAPLTITAHSLLKNRRSIAGSLIGGVAETQEMIDFCAAKGIEAMVEVIPADRVDDAYRRLAAGDVHYRFVIDNATIRPQAPADPPLLLAP